jgi:hypothetical protein
VSIEVSGSPLPEIDVKKTIKQFHAYMTNFVIDSLSGWVGESTDPIPVWSGASRATFIKAANTAKTQISIAPIVAPIGSRIPLGIEKSQFTLIVKPTSSYGWEWESDLDYIGIVDDRVQFIEAGLKFVKKIGDPTLPEPVVKK